MAKYLIVIIVLLFAMNGSTHSQEPINVVINPLEVHQTIESFSASDCWSAKDVGAYWNSDVKESIAKLLFSSGLQYDGSPEGIGLSMWRFNLGSGSVGDSDLNSTRQTESFLDDSGEGYDWIKQLGQRWFMDKAMGYGCTNFVAFANSPLVKYTINGKGYNSPGNANSNLQTDKYAAYAEYVADVMKHFEDAGKGFKYFSPVNEPQYNWDDPTQEGSPWQNYEIKRIVRELNKSFQARQLKTKILVAEAGDWTYLYATNPNKYGGRASNQIYEFFNTQTSNYIGNLPSLARVIGAHSYWTTGTNAQMADVRTQVANKAREYGLNVFQTEWSMLSGGEGIPNDLGASSYMDNALFLAKVVYSDMKHANVTSWSYWTALGVEQYNHKNRFLLISLTPAGGQYAPITFSGTATATKNLWALGNYSYFVRPGYKRIGMSGAGDMAGLMGTAYIAPDSSRIVAVYVNMANEDKKIKTQFEHLPMNPLSNKRYFTNSFYDLRKYGSASSDIYQEGKIFTIPSRSVMTFVYDLPKETASIASIAHGNFTIAANPVNRGSSLLAVLDGSNGQEVAVSLTSLHGDLVFRSNMLVINSKLDLEIPASVLPGLYLLRVSTPAKNYVNKIIVQ